MDAFEIVPGVALAVRRRGRRLNGALDGAMGAINDPN